MTPFTPAQTSNSSGARIEVQPPAHPEALE